MNDRGVKGLRAAWSPWRLLGDSWSGCAEGEPGRGFPRLTILIDDGEFVDARTSPGCLAQDADEDPCAECARLFNDPIGRAGLENHVARSITREPLMADTRVTRVLNKFGALAFPGVLRHALGKIAQRVGFPMAFISGYSVAATAIGEPDLGLLTQTEMIERARRICVSVEIPIIVDADTGYGNPLNVYRTVQELIAAGAAGCFLEDQVWPKKCGHMRGKRVIDREEYVQKIRAAVEARGDGDFFIVARTDALAVAGHGRGDRAA